MRKLKPRKEKLPKVILDSGRTRLEIQFLNIWNLPSVNNFPWSILKFHGRWNSFLSQSAVKFLLYSNIGILINILGTFVPFHKTKEREQKEVKSISKANIFFFLNCGIYDSSLYEKQPSCLQMYQTYFPTPWKYNKSKPLWLARAHKHTHTLTLHLGVTCF